jgi:8-oxo-dGTP pyrophosphatase MutT (NUDIX family)
MLHTNIAGGVVINSRGQVLVVNQRDTSWSLPKGRIQEGEDVLTAARREIYEETGIRDLAPVRELGSYQRFRIGKDGGEDETELKTISMFLFKTTESALSPTDDDIPEARWVDMEDVAGLLTHPKDKEFFSVTYRAGNL